MYLAEETSGGGDSVGELATPGQFHRRLGPESEILGGLSGLGRPTDDPDIRKGSGMSVPVDPGVEASDTTIDTTSRAIPSTAQRFSGFKLFRYDPNRCTVCLGIKSKPKGVTYIAQRQGWVKIGRTTGPVHQRIKKLNSRVPSVLMPEGMDLREPLELLYVVSRDVEHELHERYAKHHAEGEWFVADPRMLKQIAKLSGEAK